MSNLELKSREWKEFLISDIFEVSGTYTTQPKDLKKGGKTPRITCAATDNAFENTYRNKATEKGGVITIDSATVGYVSYQFTSFIATDHVEKLSLKKNSFMNRFLANFLVRAITSSTLGKYGYGYKFSQTRIKKQKILLPVNSHGEPDYKFMETYMRQKEEEKNTEYQKFIQKRFAELQNTPQTASLKEKEWGEFEIEELFNIYSGVRLTKSDMKRGNIPFIGATDSNNGITAYTSSTNNSEDKNVLGVNYNGSVVENFYHPYTAIFSDDVKRLKFKKRKGNKYLFLFVKNQIIKQREKYQYGYKFNGKRMSRQNILLPINQNQEPDYEFMENFMKNIERKKLTQYLEFKNQ